MRQYIPVITLALLSALALAVVSGGLLPSDNAVLAEHIDAPDNAPPVFATGGGSRSIAENSPPGVNIGGPISATDADGDVLTYSLEDGLDAESFDIDPSTGQLITKAALDTETKPSYSVTVTADDGREANNSSVQSVSIDVTDEDEKPAQPAPPVVTTGAVVGSETTTLEINWFAPENTGEAINDYDYRYKKTTDTTWMVIEGSTSDDDTNYANSSLEADTAYHVSVRAGSPEGDGPWSFAAVGSTNKEGNAAPEFASTTADRSVAEDTPSGQRVGATITASDANSLMLTYILEGQDKDSFNIDGSTGQIRTKAPLNFEGKSSYSVFVVVKDGDGGSDVIAVAITVGDVSEQPSRPAAPTVERVEDDPDESGDESTMMLKVSWVAPETTGPAITNYNVEYREGTSGTFLEDNCRETMGVDNCRGIVGTETVITDLMPNSSYQVRVRANSDEQNSLPSPTRTGSTMPSNNAPVFSQDTIDRTVNENTGEGTNIGSPIRATESDRSDTLTYSLVDPDPNTDDEPEDLFDIDERTGQLKTKAALNHEVAVCGYVATADRTECKYSVTVAATDQKEAMDTIEVTITVKDRPEPPSAPSGLVVTVDRNNPHNTLMVNWTAPDVTGKPPITKYVVNYRGVPSGTLPDVVGTTAATIEGLRAGTSYTVEVRAVNDEGDSSRVSSSEKTSEENNALPVFDPDTVNRQVAESTQPGGSVGDVVTATDGDDDTLEYSLEGAHHSLFNIDRSSGQITVKEPLNFEAECGDEESHDTQCNYTVVVKARDGKGGSHSATVTIEVQDDTSEAPSTPSAPTVRPAEPTDDEPHLDPTTMLAVTWPEPANAGPPITSYAIQYKVMGGGDFLTDNGDIIIFEGEDNSNTRAVITELDDDMDYVVQVMATNPEGASGWSPVRTGSTRFANTRPQFSRDTFTLNVEENTPSNRSIGRPVAATDDDGHNLTYTLEGVHKDEFTIERGSGHIRTRGDLDYESRRRYSLTVKADDNHGGSAYVSVTINVTDEIESPTAPGRPAVSAIAGSTSSVRVSWDAPSNEGRPPIVDYDVQYRTGGGVFIPWPHDESTDTSTIITDLNAGTSYEVQVKAWNMEDDSEWSASGTGSPDADPANNAPTFSGGPRTFSVAENTPAGENIRGPVTATDPDRDSLAYSLEGTDAASFYIDPATGQIQTSGPLNHEEKPSHSVTVKADDARGGMATVSVTINVTDVPGEAPEKPDTPTVVAASSTSLAVNWVAPDNPGPPITDYDYRYKEPTAAGWTEVTDTVITQTNAIVSPLRPDTSYEVQVRAKNAEANGEWSDSGTGSTNAGGANSAPVFTEGQSTTRTVIPNAQAGEHAGPPVTATDADQGDTVTYSLEGADAASFGINPANGQLLTVAGVTLDRSTYIVEVVASDGSATSRITVTITVTPNRAPVFSEGGTATRSVAENEPAGTNVGSPVVATDLNQGDTLTYTLDGADAGSFTIVPTSGQIRTSATLDYETKASYVVTVTATDRSLASASIVVTISVIQVVVHDCAGGGAVADAANNRGLVSDCDALLSARNTLEGRARLDWSESTPIEQWEGVSISGTPRRVTRLNLMDRGLSGTIPASLSRLSELTRLNLRSNPGLSGEIPDALGNLGNLRVLNLHSNSHTGAVPDLRRIAGLEELYLANNADYNADGSKVRNSGLTGRIPTWLNGMTNMEELWLWGNSLTGTVPNLSGMTSLVKLKLANNDLTGGVPQASTLPPNMTWLIIDRNPFGGTIPDLSSLSSLRLLWLHSNQLTGPVPAGNNFPASLDDLNLRDNMLTGRIPDLSNLDNLTRLRLHNNSLHGEVPATLGDLDSLKQLWLHNEVDKGRGNNSFTSIAAGVGDLADTLIEIALNGNPWNANACVPESLANVTTNDYTAAGIDVCDGS